MPIQSEVTKPIVFCDVPTPEEWAFGDKLAYLVVTKLYIFIQSIPSLLSIPGLYCLLP